MKTENSLSKKTTWHHEKRHFTTPWQKSPSNVIRYLLIYQVLSLMESLFPNFVSPSSILSFTNCVCFNFCEKNFCVSHSKRLPFIHLVTTASKKRVYEYLYKEKLFLLHIINGASRIPLLSGIRCVKGELYMMNPLFVYVNDA